MNKHFFKSIALIIILSFTSLSVAAYPWNHSIQLGYGFSHDPNHTRYNNQAVLLTSDLFPIYRSNLTFWSLTGALGHLHTNAPVNKNVTTASLALALRWYPFTFVHIAKPYLLGSAGPAYISNRWLGFNEQGKNLTFQTNIGLGVEHKCLDLNLRLHHFSNANLAKPNEGLNVLYLLSVGYLF